MTHVLTLLCILSGVKSMFLTRLHHYTSITSIKLVNILFHHITHGNTPQARIHLLWLFFHQFQIPSLLQVFQMGGYCGYRCNCLASLRIIVKNDTENNKTWQHSQAPQQFHLHRPSSHRPTTPTHPPYFCVPDRLSPELFSPAANKLLPDQTPPHFSQMV